MNEENEITLNIKRTESQLKTEILKYLNSMPLTFAFPIQIAGIPIIKNNKFVGFRKNTTRGCPDIIGCKNGRFFAMEVKKPNGKLEDHQRDFLISIDLAGGYGCVVRNIRDSMEAWEEI